MTEPARWLYRLRNFHSAVALLAQSCDEANSRVFSDLEKEGLIGRFAFSWELAWKLLKDYLADQGLAPEITAPRTVIRAAVAAGLLDDASPWLQALEVRNMIAHIYSGALRDETFTAILAKYRPLFCALDLKFSRIADEA